LASVDTSRLSFGALVAAGGGLLLLLSLFMNWFGPLSAFDLFDITDFLLLLIALVAIGFAAIQVTNTQVNLPAPAADIITLAGIIATTITFVYLVEGTERKFGIVLAFLSSLAVLLGGIVARREPAGGIAIAGAPGGTAGAGPGPGTGGSFGATPPAAAAGPLAGGGGAAPAPEATPTQPMQTQTQAPPPGGKADWYPDPQGQARLRYYDGQSWTDHTAE
jgi:hypothetical protein